MRKPITEEAFSSKQLPRSPWNIWTSAPDIYTTHIL